MSVEPQCYVCGAQVPSINGLCSDCTMREFYNPGAAHAATFGAIASLFGGTPPKVDNTPRCPNCGELMDYIDDPYPDVSGGYWNWGKGWYCVDPKCGRNDE